MVPTQVRGKPQMYKLGII